MNHDVPTQKNVLLIAAHAEADPRSVKKFLETGRVKGHMLRERLERATKEVLPTWVAPGSAPVDTSDTAKGGEHGRD